MKENKIRVPARIYDYPDKNDFNKIIAEIDVTDGDIKEAIKKGFGQHYEVSKVENILKEVENLLTKGNHDTTKELLNTTKLEEEPKKEREKCKGCVSELEEACQGCWKKTVNGVCPDYKPKEGLKRSCGDCSEWTDEGYCEKLKKHIFVYDCDYFQPKEQRSCSNCGHCFNEGDYKRCILLTPAGVSDCITNGYKDWAKIPKEKIEEEQKPVEPDWEEIEQDMSMDNLVHTSQSLVKLVSIVKELWGNK